MYVHTVQVQDNPSFFFKKKEKQIPIFLLILIPISDFLSYRLFPLSSFGSIHMYDIDQVVKSK